MAKKFKCRSCGKVKDVKTGFYKCPGVKTGHDNTCKVCRHEQAKARLEERRAAGEKILDERGRYIKRKTDADGNYIRRLPKVGQGGNPRSRNPTPEQIAHGTWLIRTQAFFDRFFSTPSDKRNCMQCLIVCKNNMTDIVDCDYY
ncbi:MAG TPA: hypothetical protein ENH94_04405 [Phycisphaerales bacterium]|nr:hypothetical protein [Phycisphaerales bacterium]